MQIKQISQENAKNVNQTIFKRKGQYLKVSKSVAKEIETRYNREEK